MALKEARRGLDEDLCRHGGREEQQQASVKPRVLRQPQLPVSK